MMAASGLTVAITRTALSTPIILMALTGQAALLAPCLCASLVVGTAPGTACLSKVSGWCTLLCT